MLLVSLLLSLRGTIRGRLLLAGALGYFTYTYASYCFLAMYNDLFLVYVLLFSGSLFAFILVFRSVEREGVLMKTQLPAVSIGFILLLIAFLIIMLWLGRIAGGWRDGTVPALLEHYTTLVIQALDLAVLLPLMVLTGALLVRRQSYGYLLAPVVLVKSRNPADLHILHDDWDAEGRSSCLHGRVDPVSNVQSGSHLVSHSCTAQRAGTRTPCKPITYRIEADLSEQSDLDRVCKQIRMYRKKAALLLQARLNAADVVNLSSGPLPDLTGYGTVILGGSIYYGRIRKEMAAFTARHKQELFNQTAGLVHLCRNDRGEGRAGA
ncbi:flavodoxin domain-containing protein [Paenibacillus rhizoplanae]